MDIGPDIENLEILASVEALREVLIAKIDQAIRIKDQLEDLACMQIDIMPPLQPNERDLVERLTQKMKAIYGLLSNE